MSVTIRRALQGLPVKAGAQYPSPLPADLRPFYCYPIDSTAGTRCWCCPRH